MILGGVHFGGAPFLLSSAFENDWKIQHAILSPTRYGDARLVDATEKVVGRHAPSIADRSPIRASWNNTFPAKDVDDFAQVLWHRVRRWCLRAYVSRRATVAASTTASAAPCSVGPSRRWLEPQDFSTKKLGEKVCKKRGETGQSGGIYVLRTISFLLQMNQMQLLGAGKSLIGISMISRR